MALRLRLRIAAFWKRNSAEDFFLPSIRGQDVPRFASFAVKSFWPNVFDELAADYLRPSTHNQGHPEGLRFFQQAEGSGVERP